MTELQAELQIKMKKSLNDNFQILIKILNSKQYRTCTHTTGEMRSVNVLTQHNVTGEMNTFACVNTGLCTHDVQLKQVGVLEERQEW